MTTTHDHLFGFQTTIGAADADAECEKKIQTPQHERLVFIGLLHQFYRWSNCVRNYPSWSTIQRTHHLRIRVVPDQAGVLDHDCGQVRAATVIGRTVEESATPASLARRGRWPAACRHEGRWAVG